MRIQDRLKRFFSSGLFLAATGVCGALLLTWPLVTIPSQGSPAATPIYIYGVWAALILAAWLWTFCRPHEESAPPDSPAGPEETSARPAPPDPAPGQNP